jgi:large subunit ribosomal protein L27
MSHTKAGGAAKNVHDSAGKRLGVKLFGGEVAKGGAIIVRQRGTRMEPGVGTALGTDHTIYATQSGVVKFTQKQVAKFTGQKVRRTFVSVVAEE